MGNRLIVNCSDYERYFVNKRGEVFIGIAVCADPDIYFENIKTGKRDYHSYIRGYLPKGFKRLFTAEEIHDNISQLTEGRPCP